MIIHWILGHIAGQEGHDPRPLRRRVVHNGGVDLGGSSAPSTRGSLLVAVPLMDEPTFHRTVIFMLQHDEDGALGLVINRPTDEDQLPGLEPWMFELSQPQVVFE